LQSILLPRSVKILFSQCFYDCSSLHDVRFESNSQPEWIDPRTVRGCHSLESRFVPGRT
jgi:hypothetical protein